MWRCYFVAVPHATVNGAGCEVLNERRCHELQARLVLREIDVATPAGALAELEGGQDGDRPVGDRDVVDIGPPEKRGRAIRPAGQVGKAAERGQVRPEARAAGVRTGPPLVAGADG